MYTGGDQDKDRENVKHQGEDKWLIAGSDQLAM